MCGLRDLHWLALLALLAAAPLAAADQAVLVPRLRLRIVAPLDRSQQLERLAAICAARLQLHQVDPAADGPALTIQVGDAAGPDAALELLPTLKLAEQSRVPQDYHLLMTALLWRQVGGEATRAVTLQWLAAALWAEESQPAGRQPDYRPIFRSDPSAALDVIKLLETPVAPRFSAVYQLYALHCHLLLRDLLSGRQSISLPELLRKHAQAPDAVDVVARLAGPFTGPEQRQRLQQWYLAGLRQRAHAQAETYSGPQAMQALAAIRQVKISQYRAAATTAAEQQSVDLARLPEVVKDAGQLRSLAATVQEQLFQLSRKVPLLLAAQFLRYMQAVDELRAGRVRRFRRLLKAADRDLPAALARWQAVDSYLHNFSSELVPPEEQFPVLLEVHEQARRSQYQLAPDIHDFLQQL